MAKTVRRYKFQPAVEGLDRRIAPSGVVAAPPSDSADTSGTTNIGPGTSPGSGGGSGPVKPGGPSQ